jgi:hypothetical protein
MRDLAIRSESCRLNPREASQKLSFPMFDLVLLVVIGVSQLALIIIGFVASAEPVRKVGKSIFVAIGLTGLIGCGATVWSGIRSTNVQRWRQAFVKIEQKLGISKEGNILPLIAVDCREATLPTLMPTDGLSFIDFRHVDGEADSTGLAGNMSSPGQPLTWPQDRLGFPVMRCDLSNEESYNLLSVFINIHVKYYEPIVKDSQTSPSSVVYEQIWPIGIAKIDAGKIFSFYGYTSGKYFVSANFSEALVTSLDNNKKEPLKLVLTNWQALLFAPKL